MATFALSSSFPAPFPTGASQESRIRSLQMLNDAAQRINSILDLDQLLDQIVNDVVIRFGFVETGIMLLDEERGELVLAGMRGCTKHCVGHRYRVGREGLVGHAAGTLESIYVADVTKDPRYIACEPDTRSEMAIPLVANGRLVGVFTASHPALDGFTPEQQELLRALAGHIAVAIENARRFQQVHHSKLRLDRSEQEARAIQQALFPPYSPRVPGFIVDGLCVPAGAVGGDWYDFIPLDEGRWGLVLADVSGKGMAAALLMSATRGILRTLAEFEPHPAVVLERLNRMLLKDIPAGRYVTMVYAVLDPAAGSLRFANAGHPWPLFVNGAARFLQTTSGLPLGIAQCEYDEHEVKLAPGSSLLFYSDGITEADANGEEFGMERLMQHARHPGLCSEKLLSAVTSYAGTTCLADDATVIVVRHA